MLFRSVDFAPTLLDFAGGAVPDDVQGRSFRSLLETGLEAADWKQEAYYRYWMHMAHHDNPAHMGIRTKTHKLIYYYGCNYDGGYKTPAAWELYDLRNDPQETKNLYGDPSQAALVADLKQRLKSARKRSGDDGSHFPQCETIVQEYWDYDDTAREKAVSISHAFLRRRLSELEAGKRNPQTHKGLP